MEFVASSKQNLCNHLQKAAPQGSFIDSFCFCNILPMHKPYGAYSCVTNYKISKFCFLSALTIVGRTTAMMMAVTMPTIVRVGTAT